MANVTQAASLAVLQADAIAHTAAALGRENAMQWLQTSHPAFTQRTPLDVILLGKTDELQLLHELLYALEYGVFV